MTAADAARSRAALALLVVLAATSCGVPAEARAKRLPHDRLPVALQDPAAADAPSTPRLQPVTVWLVRDDALTAVVHFLQSPVSPTDVLRRVEVGATQTEQAQGLRSAIPDVGMVRDAIVAAGSATVQLGESFDDIPPRDQLLAIGQIVLTLSELQSVERVQFVRSDANLAVPRADGTTTDSAVSADDYESLVWRSP